jgi:hypothetical protein
MKIGFSYSRCVRDIVDGKVDMDDVLVIVARTSFDPNDDEQWAGIWHGYRTRNGFSNPEWEHVADNDQERYRSVSQELYAAGKLHQPRKFGAHPPRTTHIWVDTGPIGHELYAQPDAVRQAWDHYLTLSALTKGES